jgi:hypothetical protein
MVHIISFKNNFLVVYLNDNNLQLGMMVIAIGLSSYNLALFHLINHAFTLKGACKIWLIAGTPLRVLGSRGLGVLGSWGLGV